MDTIYDVRYRREFDNREDMDFEIGLFRTNEDALAAIDSLKVKPGFADWPQGFVILPIRINATAWQHGFMTVFGPPPKDAVSEAFDLPYKPKAE